MPFLRGLLATLLTVTLVGAVFSVVSARTLFDIKFLQAEAEKAKTYEAVSAAIPTLLTQHQTDVSADQLRSFQQVANPEYVRAKVQSALTQIEAHYRHGGPEPVLDFSDLEPKLRAEGIEVEPGTFKPVTITDQQLPLGPVIAGSQTSSWAAPLTAALLALLLALLCRRTGNYRPLARSVATAGGLIALLAAALALVPGLSRSFQPGGDAGPFLVIARDLGAVLARDLSVWFAVPGVVLLLGGILSWIFLHPHEAKPRLKRLGDTLKPSRKSAKG